MWPFSRPAKAAAWDHTAPPPNPGAPGAGAVGVVRVPEDALKKLQSLAHVARAAQFEKAKAGAIAALPEEPEYRVIQGNDGLWRSESRVLKIYPPYYGGQSYARYMSPPIVPEEVGRVDAEWTWHQFAPRFKAEAEAKKWLRDYLKPPTPKVVGFDRDGNERPPATTPSSA